MADTKQPGHDPNTPSSEKESSENPPSSAPEAAANQDRGLSEPEKEKEKEGVRPDGKRELKENDAYDKLAYCWPTWKKWLYLSAIAAVQISMNFNTSVYPSAVPQLSEHWGISEQHARTGQMIYLVTYAVGCELWAPWSEEFGRWPILMLSMFLINIWQIPAALSQNWGTILVARGLVRLLQDDTSWTIALTCSGWDFYCWRQCHPRLNCRPLRT
ncbi:hypothetical protein IMZ48_12180 [Candidatus Bathyarchaeota archaeon]|nr:hypothetical protein [Candidatus Bathyarchaeota archaeon]